MYVLHFQDSQVARVSVEGGELHVVLSAVAVSLDGEQVASGYLAPVTLVLRQASWQGDLGHSLGRLSGGELSVQAEGAAPRQRTLLLPCDSGTVQLRLDFANSTVLQISADALHCALNGDERYTEVYAC